MTAEGSGHSRVPTGRRPAVNDEPDALAAPEISQLDPLDPVQAEIRESIAAQHKISVETVNVTRNPKPTVLAIAAVIGSLAAGVTLVMELVHGAGK